MNRETLELLKLSIKESSETKDVGRLLQIQNSLIVLLIEVLDASTGSSRGQIDND